MVMSCSDEVYYACMYKCAHGMNMCTVECTTAFVFNVDASASRSGTIRNYLRNGIDERENREYEECAPFGNKSF